MKRLAETKNPQLIVGSAEVLAVVASKLQGQQADDVGLKLAMLVQPKYTLYPVRFAPVWKGLATLGDKEARVVADKLTDALVDLTDPSHRRGLLESLSKVLARLDKREAEDIVTAALQKIRGRMDRGTALLNLSVLAESCPGLLSLSNKAEAEAEVLAVAQLINEIMVRDRPEDTIGLMPWPRPGPPWPARSMRNRRRPPRLPATASSRCSKRRRTSTRRFRLTLSWAAIADRLDEKDAGAISRQHRA